MTRCQETRMRTGIEPATAEAYPGAPPPELPSAPWLNQATTPVILSLLLALASPARAQDVYSVSNSINDRIHDTGQDSAITELAAALNERMTVHTTPSGRRVYVRHCRTADNGCQVRLRMYARAMVGVARESGLDPFLLAAVAVRESGLNPRAVGPAGERGLFQAHPRWHRLGDTVAEQARVAANHIVSAIERCGSLEAGLGAYNSGRCGVTRYSRGVLRTMRELRP